MSITRQEYLENVEEVPEFYRDISNIVGDYTGAECDVNTQQASRCWSQHENCDNYCWDTVEHLNAWLVPIFENFEQSETILAVQDKNTYTTKYYTRPNLFVLSELYIFLRNINDPDSNIFEDEDESVNPYMAINMNKNESNQSLYIGLYVYPSILEIIDEKTWQSMKNNIIDFKNKHLINIESNIGENYEVAEDIILFSLRITLGNLKNVEFTFLSDIVYQNLLLPLFNNIIQIQQQVKIELGYKSETELNTLENLNSLKKVNKVFKFLNRMFNFYHSNKQEEEELNILNFINVEGSNNEERWQRINNFVNNNYLIGLPNAFHPGDVELKMFGEADYFDVTLGAQSIFIL